MLSKPQHSRAVETHCVWILVQLLSHLRRTRAAKLKPGTPVNTGIGGPIGGGARMQDWNTYGIMC